MKPTFFGPDETPLFGVYHPPVGGDGAGRAVVLCHPVGHEYFRAHRAIRLLAGELVRAGAHAFRFDYHATGDSSGSCGAGTVRRWVRDVTAAIEDLRARALRPRVTLVGVRFGGTLAALAAAESSAVERLVLWDPIHDGAEYVRQLRALAAERGEVDGAASGGPIRAVGCLYSGELLEEMAQTRLSVILEGVGAEIAVLVGTPSGRADVPAYTTVLDSAVDDPAVWALPNQEPFLPRAAIIDVARHAVA